MDWGHNDPQKRGPIVVGRSQATVRRRNGEYSSIYVPHLTADSGKLLEVSYANEGQIGRC